MRDKLTELLRMYDRRVKTYKLKIKDINGKSSHEMPMTVKATEINKLHGKLEELEQIIRDIEQVHLEIRG